MEPTLAASTYIASAIALFTITNPIGSLPIFLGATSAQPPAQQRRMAWLVALAVFVVLAIALIIGTYILQAFGIDIIAFKIAGNLLVAVIGWAMLTAKQNPAHAAKGSRLSSSRSPSPSSRARARSRSSSRTRTRTRASGTTGSASS